MTRSLLAVLALISALASFGCAEAARPPEFPGTRATAAAERSGASLPLYRRHGGHGKKSLEIPDGAECLALLEQHDIAFHELPPKPGMVTPVAVTGKIGGIEYDTWGKSSLVCDCRLVVALDSLGPELRAFGVSEVRHSGAYVYRTTRRGGPSLHALGLAIDVHAVRVDNHGLVVAHDYVRGEGPTCNPDSAVLNRLACELARTGLFQQVITPDDDSDHRDHLHLAIAPL
jgi:hypothetical protein